MSREVTSVCVCVCVCMCVEESHLYQRKVGKVDEKTRESRLEPKKKAKKAHTQKKSSQVREVE